MDAVCLKCEAHLDLPWKFCPNCGAAAPHEAHKPADTEKAPVKAPFSGLLVWRHRSAGDDHRRRHALSHRPWCHSRDSDDYRWGPGAPRRSYDWLWRRQGKMPLVRCTGQQPPRRREFPLRGLSPADRRQEREVRHRRVEQDRGPLTCARPYSPPAAARTIMSPENGYVSIHFSLPGLQQGIHPATSHRGTRQQ